VKKFYLIQKFQQNLQEIGLLVLPLRNKRQRHAEPEGLAYFGSVMGRVAPA
jgi:hypothetical protein